MKKQSKQFPKRLQDYKKKELLATGRFVKEKFKLTY